jgi:hypothetical protein
MSDQDHWRLASRSFAANQRVEVEVQDVIVPPTREQVMVSQRRSGCDYNPCPRLQHHPAAHPSGLAKAEVELAWAGRRRVDVGSLLTG